MREIDTGWALRSELTPPPARIAALSVHRGYPVPWFVAYPHGPEGEPEFRIADKTKWPRAVHEKLCWVCGQPLGTYLVFVLGPMCGITRTTSEPASHRECAEWSVRNCPFLTRPHMVRREGNMPEVVEAPGIPILRNPGVTLLWITKTFTLFRGPDRQFLIRVGDTEEVHWYAEGRRATRAEVDASIEGGLPKLAELARAEGPKAEAELRERVQAFEFYLPG